jgi:hypothetical protein
VAYLFFMIKWTANKFQVVVPGFTYNERLMGKQIASNFVRLSYKKTGLNTVERLICAGVKSHDSG